MNKSEIVDWLIANDSLALLLFDTVNSYGFLLDDNPFSEEIKKQKIEFVRNSMATEASKTIGLTIEEFHDKISEEEFKNYLEKVLNQ